MLAIAYSFPVLLSSVTAITTSASQPQVGQDQHQNNSRLFPPSGGNSSESITNSVTTSVSSTSVSLAGPSSSGFENATGAIPTPTTFRGFHHTFVTSVSPSPSSVSSTSVSPVGQSFSASENANGATPTPTTFGGFHHTFVTFVSPSPSSVSSTNFTNHTSSSLISHSSGSADMPFTTAKTTAAFFPSGMSNRTITASPTPTLNHTHFMPSESPAVTSMTSTSEHGESHTTSHHVICKKSGSCSPAPTSTSKVDKKLQVVITSGRHSSGTDAQTAESTRTSVLHTTSHHVICKKSGSCSPTSTSTSRIDKKLQVAVTSGSHSSGTDAKATESTRTSGAPSDHGRDIRPTESASNLPFGDISSNNTDSGPHNGTLSTAIPTPGTSAIPTATTDNTQGQFGLNRFPIPSGPPHQSQSSPPKPQAARNKHLPLIIGLVVGSTLFLGIVSAIGFYLFKKRRKSRFRYDDSIPLDFTRIQAPPPPPPLPITTIKSFQRKKVTRKPPPPLTLPDSPYAPAVNVANVNKPLPISKPEDPPADQDLIQFDVDDKYYGIAICK